MAAGVQILPYILISKTLIRTTTMYSKTPTYHVQGTIEKLGATINQFQKNYPAFISVYTSNNTTNFQQLINPFYPAMTAFTDQYSLPNIFFDIGQL